MDTYMNLVNDEVVYELRCESVEGTSSITNRVMFKIVFKKKYHLEKSTIRV